MIVLMQNALIRSLAAGPDLFGTEDAAAASFLEFLGILFLGFFVMILAVIGVMVYRHWKIRRLTDPAKERIYKH